MKKIFIAFLGLISFNANAQTIEQFNQAHQQKQQQLFASLDYCTNIGSKEIFNLGTQNLQALKKDLSVIEKQFKKFKEQKANCFDNSRYYLDSIIADNMIFMQSNERNIDLEMQNKIDQELIDIIDIRKQINLELLDSIISDIKKSIKHATVAQMKTDFITESTKTKRLISQELHVIYDSMEDQLKVDRQKLELTEDKSTIKVANIAVRSAFLSLNRSLILFENIEKEPREYNIAKIKTHVRFADSKLSELKAFSKSLDELDTKEQINLIMNKLSILNVDLEVALKTIADDSFPENYLTWAGKIYQQLSDTITQLQSVLDTIYLVDMTTQSKPVDITSQGIEELSIPKPVEKKLKPAKLLEVKESDSTLR